MFKTYSRKIYNWAIGKAHSPKNVLWIFLIFTLEVLFFLPLDALLVLFCAHNPSKRFAFSFFAALGSIVSGIIGFGIGYLLWDSCGDFILRYLLSPSSFHALANSFHQYEFGAVSLGALLPIPFKVLAFAAGFSKLDFGCFIGSVFAARLLRFYTIAWAIGRWKAPVRAFFDRYSEKIAAFAGIKALFGFGLLWALS